MYEPSPINATHVFPRVTPDFVKANYPCKFKLIQVQLFHRHGERSPTTTRFANVTPKSWDFCKLANGMRKGYREMLVKAVNNTNRSYSLHTQAVDGNMVMDNFREMYHDERVFPVYQSVSGSDDAQSPDGLKVQEINLDERTSDKTCGWGQLTDVGWNTMHKTGGYLRSLYIDQLGFLPPDAKNLTQNQMYLRTTDYSRTIESLYQVLSGLYPIYDKDILGSAGSVYKGRFSINVRPKYVETLILNYNCKNLKKNLIDMHQKALELYTDEKNKAEELIDNSPTIGKEAREILENTDVPSQFQSVYDTLIAMRAHNIAIPPEIPLSEVDELGKLAAKQWMFSLVFSPELGRMQWGPTGLEVVNNMISMIFKDKGLTPADKYGQVIDFSLPLPVVDVPSFSISSGHDTTIVPMLGALGFYRQDGTTDPQKFTIEWPVYGSVIALELFEGPKLEPKPTIEKRKDWPSTIPSGFNADGYYVRANFNGSPITIPKCLEPGNHDPEMGPTMCTLDAFFQQLQPMVLTTKEWKELCRS
ncbi:putative acid phosphatase [Smittium mucronatum]|uniref:Putative acid phosphatase n=1 Tax=Smittium mucronatum TaxID=133383 RepID=A0A1R0H5J0_9FUNG|nr:putative acid phosphatase [Smittium mucronatum]